MVWFRVDDNLAFHPKVMQAQNPAMGLWVRAGSWAAQQLTDGVVPQEIAKNIGGKREIDRLVDNGLWLPVDSGFVFHQWTERNPSRSQIESRRASGAKRLQRWREQHERGDEPPHDDEPTGGGWE